MVFGSLFHMLVLEPERVDKEIATGPDCARRSAADKDKWADFWSSTENCIRVDVNGRILSKDKDGKIQADPNLNVETAMIMAEKLMEHPVAKLALKDGMREKSLYSMDEKTGILKRCRIDFIPTAGNALIDIKSTGDASEKKFIKSIGNYNYHIQGAYYLDQANELGLERECFIFLAQEKVAPYSVMAHQLDEDFLQIGRDTYRRNLDLLSECINKDEWPGYSTDINIIKPLPWMY